MIHQWDDKRTGLKPPAMEKENIKVAIRIKPLPPLATCPWRYVGRDSITTREGWGNEAFSFDRIYQDQASSQQIFDELGSDIVKSVLNGYSATIFAYGQTSSGKTFTMRGTEKIPGIVTLAFHYLYHHLHDENSVVKSMEISYLEVYNEIVRDLLAPGIDSRLTVMDNYGDVYVHGASKHTCRSKEEAMGLYCQGDERRAIGSTQMNERSSRSHSILQIHLKVEICGSESRPVLNLVDLAGSEKARLTGAEGQQLKEGGHINKSLLALTSVISKLSESSHHIPYRDSKLTRILQPALGGHAKTMVICTITPSVRFFEESLSTLKFAARAKTIKNTPELNLVRNGKVCRHMAVQTEQSWLAPDALRSSRKREGDHPLKGETSVKRSKRYHSLPGNPRTEDARWKSENPVTPAESPGKEDVSAAATSTPIKTEMEHMEAVSSNRRSEAADSVLSATSSPLNTPRRQIKSLQNKLRELQLVNEFLQGEAHSQPREFMRFADTVMLWGEALQDVLQKDIIDEDFKLEEPPQECYELENSDLPSLGPDHLGVILSSLRTSVQEFVDRGMALRKHSLFAASECRRLKTELRESREMHESCVQDLEVMEQNYQEVVAASTSEFEKIETSWQTKMKTHEEQQAKALVAARGAVADKDLEIRKLNERRDVDIGKLKKENDDLRDEVERLRAFLEAKANDASSSTLIPPEDDKTEAWCKTPETTHVEPNAPNVVVPPKGSGLQVGRSRTPQTGSHRLSTESSLPSRSPNSSEKDRLSGANESLQKANLILQEANSSLQSSLREHQDKLVSLSMQVAGVTAERDQSRRATSTTQEQCAKLSNELLAVTEERDKAFKDLEEKENLVGLLRSKLQDLPAIQELKQTVDAQRQQIQELDAIREAIGSRTEVDLVTAETQTTTPVLVDKGTTTFLECRDGQSQTVSDVMDGVLHRDAQTQTCLETQEVPIKVLWRSVETQTCNATNETNDIGVQVTTLTMNDLEEASFKEEKLKELQCINDIRNRRIETLLHDLAAKESECVALDQRKKVMERSISEMHESIQSSEATRRGLMNEQVALREQIQSLESKERIWLNEKSLLDEELATGAQRSRDAAKRIIESERCQWEMDREDLERQLKSLEDDRKHNEACIESLEAERLQLIGRVEELENAQEELESHLGRLREEIAQKQRAEDERKLQEQKLVQQSGIAIQPSLSIDSNPVHSSSSTDEGGADENLAPEADQAARSKSQDTAGRLEPVPVSLKGPVNDHNVLGSKESGDRRLAQERGRGMADENYIHSLMEQFEQLEAKLARFFQSDNVAAVMEEDIRILGSLITNRCRAKYCPRTSGIHSFVVKPLLTAPGDGLDGEEEISLPRMRQCIRKTVLAAQKMCRERRLIEERMLRIWRNYLVSEAGRVKATLQVEFLKGRMG